MNIFLIDANKLNGISLAVSITVIILIFICLSLCLYLYYRYYRKCIDNKIEDDYIKNEIKGENKKFFKNFEGLKNSSELTKDQKVEYYKANSLVKYINDKNKGRNIIKVVVNIVLCIFYAVFIAILAFAAYFRATTNEQAYFGDTAYVVIQSGSMEEVNSSNTYIEENNLTDQIETFSMIGLTEVTSPSDLKLYDIVGYYNSDNELIVHRIISITEDASGNQLYTLRGDANSYSDPEERDLTISDIKFKYNGWQNFGLGMVVNYVRSNVGIIAICLGLIFIGVYDFLDIILGKRIKLRKEEIYPVIDEENIRLLEGLVDQPKPETHEEVKETVAPLEEVEALTSEEQKVDEIHEEPIVTNLETVDEIVPEQTLEDKLIEEEPVENSLLTQDEVDEELEDLVEDYEPLVYSVDRVGESEVVEEENYLYNDDEELEENALVAQGDEDEDLNKVIEQEEIEEEDNEVEQNDEPLDYTVDRVGISEVSEPLYFYFDDEDSEDNPLLEQENDEEILEENALYHQEDELIKAPRKKRVPFATKLEQADEALKAKYEEIKNFCLEIYGLKSRVSVAADNYRLHRIRYLSITIRGKSLVLHLNLNYEDYQDSVIPVKISEKKSYQDVPVIFKVRSNLSLKRAKTLITQMMEKHGISAKTLK